MYVSTELQGILKAFFIDSPEATWEDITAALKSEADLLFARRVEPQYLGDYYNLFEDHLNVLREFVATMPLSVKQAKTIKAAQDLFKATQRKLRGHPEDLASIVQGYEELMGSHRATDVPQGPLSLSSSVRGPSSSHQVSPSKHSGRLLSPRTFKDLSETYMDEHKDNIKATTTRTYWTTMRVLTEAFEAAGVMNLVDHSRADLVKVKQQLSEGRAVPTVNKYLTTLVTVLTWASDNGLINNNYSQRLKITKGTESDRRAFTTEQIEAVLKVSKEARGWTQWVCALGAVTGARQQEIMQLTKEDIIESALGVSIDINERGDSGKSVKNSGSERIIPLIDCKWLDLKGFMEFVSKQPSGAYLFASKNSARKGKPLVSKRMMDVVRAAVGDDRALVFHSFRHSLSGLLQSNEVSLQVSAAILGHKTGSVTFDVYGTTMGQDTLRSALMKVLPALPVHVVQLPVAA
ncbi:tyrosine-type recombinase/integrase [Pseudomonas petrae]|uniref:tyrosine-type recombinase/integrase n=1 Tax=Pseudomonas petrae TaxID=2912190 RepID=UPI001EEF9BB5|nr:tyrosine-type recombinase/integrase [Pseudomonas petrae]MCF7532775.1 tyrosine-type recombinase/integrase [Pseudomonas petrae]MCF7557147.1 tyrosine-type recombinase/integrase [Pseudomonas petrae]